LIVFDAGWIPGLTNQRGVTGGWLTLIAAFYLFALAAVAWVLFSRIAARRANRLIVSGSGVTAVLPDLAQVLFSWADPGFEATITQWSTDASRDRSIQLRDGRLSAFGFATAAGADVLEGEARRNNLKVESKVMGKSPRTWVVVRIEH
jgi:hypothetical protein